MNTDLNYDDEDARNIEAVAEVMLVLGEMARRLGVCTVEELGDLPALTEETKAKYLALAKARKERGDAG